MAITKKTAKVDSFINKAQADVNREVVKKRTRTPTKDDKEASAKTTRMTFYMTDEMYFAWQKYKLEQLSDGNKVTFQGTVEQYLEKLVM